MIANFFVFDVDSSMELYEKSTFLFILLGNFPDADTFPILDFG